MWPLIRQNTVASCFLGGHFPIFLQEKPNAKTCGNSHLGRYAPVFNNATLLHNLDTVHRALCILSLPCFTMSPCFKVTWLSPVTTLSFDITLHDCKII